MLHNICLFVPLIPADLSVVFLDVSVSQHLQHYTKNYSGGGSILHHSHCQVGVREDHLWCLPWKVEHFPSINQSSDTSPCNLVKRRSLWVGQVSCYSLVKFNFPKNHPTTELSGFRRQLDSFSLSERALPCFLITEMAAFPCGWPLSRCPPPVSVLGECLQSFSFVDASISPLSWCK